MADLEQRRQSYNSNLSRRQWEGDPQGKLIETIGPLLEWLGQQHRAKDALTPEEQAVATDALTQGGLLASYLMPQIGIPANIAYEADQLEKEHAAGNADASVAPLALAALPMGALESRAGNLVGRGARAVRGAERALGPAAVIGGPMLMAGSAQAGEDDPAGGEGDPVRTQYERQLEQLTTQIEATTKRRDEEAADGGYGPKAKAADEQLNGLMEQQRDITEKLRAYKSPDDIATMEGDRWGTLGKGAAIGAGLSLPFIAGGALKRFTGARDFERVAGQLTSLMRRTPEALPGSLAGDSAFSLVNEGYRAGNAAAPFVRRGGGTFTPASEIGGRRARASRDSELFAHAPHIPGGTVLPALAYGEGAFSTARGAGVLPGFDDTPEERSAWTKFGLGSLAAATAFKGGKKLGDVLADTMLPAASASSRAAVTQARSRLEREMADGAEPGLLKRLTGGGRRGGNGGTPSGGAPGGSEALPGSQPQLLPGNPPRPQSGTRPNSQAPAAASQTASEVSSVPGSLAPDTGAKKVKPKKDAQGRWRGEHGHYTGAPSKGGSRDRL